MESTVRVSMIIPTRNRSKLLARSVAHAFSQTNTNLEVVVSNNASEDDTECVLRNLRIEYPELHCVNHMKLLPLSVHWDTVIRHHSTGDLLIVVPDDDVLIDPSYLQKVVGLFRRFETVGVVFGNYKAVTLGGTETWRSGFRFDQFICRAELLKVYGLPIGGREVFIPHLTAVFSRKAYNKVGGFDFDCLSPDAYLWLKILLFYDAGFVQDTVAAYLVHGRNLTRTADIDRIFTDTTTQERISSLALLSSVSRNIVRGALRRNQNLAFRRYHLSLLRNLFRGASQKPSWRQIRRSRALLLIKDGGFLLKLLLSKWLSNSTPTR